MTEEGFPVRVEAESVKFEVLPTGELQTIISRPGAEDIVQVSEMPDGVYDQLLDLGIISHD